MADREDSPPTRPFRAPQPPPESAPIILVISGPITRADVPGLCGRVRLALETSDAELVVCDVGALADPDAVAVDALARLQLTARRLGRHVRLGHACDELQDLLVLTGLDEAVPLYTGLWREPKGQTEEREPAGRIEEETNSGDPVA